MKKLVKNLKNWFSKLFQSPDLDLQRFEKLEAKKYPRHFGSFERFEDKFMDPRVRQLGGM